MPHYLVEVREHADPKSLTRTRPTLWTHMTPEDMSYDVGHVFELEGRLLEVTHVEEGGRRSTSGSSVCRSSSSAFTAPT